MKLNLNYKNPWVKNDQPWASTFGLTCRRLWDTRNKRLFSNSSFTAHSVLQKILAMARKDEEALRPEANPGSRKFECNVGWEWPPEGWVKANCDGAYKASSGLAGAGGKRLQRELDSWYMQEHWPM